MVMNVLREHPRAPLCLHPPPCLDSKNKTRSKQQEKVATLQLVMFLETLVRCSTMNQTLMVGNEDGIKARMCSGCL